MEPAGGQSKTLVTGRAREWANMQKKLHPKSLQVSEQEPADPPGSGGERGRDLKTLFPPLGL